MDNATWTAVADPHRWAVLDVLRDHPCAVGELQDALGYSQPATSKHLRVLRDAGLVTVRVDAQRRIYALNTAPIEELDFWLAPYRALCNESLDAIRTHLPAFDRPRRGSRHEA